MTLSSSSSSSMGLVFFIDSVSRFNPSVTFDTFEFSLPKAKDVDDDDALIRFATGGGVVVVVLACFFLFWLASREGRSVLARAAVRDFVLPATTTKEKRGPPWFGRE